MNYLHKAECPDQIQQTEEEVSGKHGRVGRLRSLGVVAVNHSDDGGEYQRPRKCVQKTEIKSNSFTEIITHLVCQKILKITVSSIKINLYS